MRRWRLVAAVVVTLAPSLLGILVEAKSYKAERFDVTVDIVADGSLVVTEEVTFRFSGGPFTRVYREIPWRRTDGITIVATLVDGQPTGAQATGTSVNMVRRENRLRVTWHIPPASDTARRFTLTYKVAGVVERGPQHDVLAWTVLPRDHDYEIADHRFELRWPPTLHTLAPVETVDERRARPRIEPSEGSAKVTLAASAIGRDGSYTVRARFPLASFTGSAPQWQQRLEGRARYTRQAASVAGAIGGSLLLLLGLVWWRVPRGHPEPSTRVAGDGRVPTSLPVALAGALADSGSPSSLHAVSTLLDLARQRYVTIEPLPRERRWTPQQFAVKRIAASQPVHTHERAVLEAVFGSEGAASAGGAGVDYAKAVRHLASHGGPFKAAVRSELRVHGFIDDDRVAGRQLLTRLAGALAVLAAAALALVAFLLRSTGPGPLLIPAAIGLAAAFGAALASSVSPLSGRGLSERARWARFADTVKKAARGRTPLPTGDALERWLPLSVALGAGALLGKLASRGQLPLPPWFRARTGAGDDGSAAFAALLSSSHGAGPGDAGAGGGGGAAGGGSSGAS